MAGTKEERKQRVRAKKIVLIYESVHLCEVYTLLIPLAHFRRFCDNIQHHIVLDQLNSKTDPDGQVVRPPRRQRGTRIHVEVASLVIICGGSNAFARGKAPSKDYTVVGRHGGSMGWW